MDFAELNLVINTSKVKSGTSDLNIFIKATAQAESNVNNLGTASGKLQSGLGGLLSLITKLTAGYSAWRVAQEAVKQGAQYEAQIASLGNLLKSADRARALLADLDKFTNETPFEMPGVIKATQRLLAYGFAAEQVVPMLKNIGDAAIALNAGQEGIDSIVRALGQMQSKGRVVTQDMNQLAEVGINAFKYLADSANVTQAEMRDLAEKGVLNSAAAVQIILEGMGKQFAGATKSRMDTTLGEWNRLTATVIKTLRNTGLAFIESFNVEGSISKVTGFVKNLGNVLGDVFRVASGGRATMAENQRVAEDIVRVIKIIIAVIAAMMAYKVAGWIYEITTQMVALALSVTTGLSPAMVTLIALFTALGAVSFGRHLYEEFRIVQEAGQATIDIVKELGITFKASMNEVANSFLYIRDLTTKGLSEADRLFNERSVNNNAQYQDSLKDIQTVSAGVFNDIANKFGNAEMKSKSFQEAAKGLSISLKSDLLATLKELGGAVAGALGINVPALKARIEKPFSGQSNVGLPQTLPNVTEPLIGIDPRKISSGFDKLRDMTEDLQTQLRVVGLTQDQAELLTKEYKMQEVIHDHMIDQDAISLERAQQIVGEYKKQYEQLQRMRVIKDLADDVGHAFSDAFGAIVTGSKSAKDAIQDLIKAIQQAILQRMILTPLANAISAGITGVAGGLFASASTGVVSNYNLNAVGAPGLAGEPATGSFGPPANTTLPSSIFVPHAMGDVVNRMSYFPTSDGKWNSIAEGNRSEGILPLARDSQGRLGVSSSGGGTTVVQMHIYGVRDVDGFKRSEKQITSRMRSAVGGGK